MEQIQNLKKEDINTNDHCVVSSTSPSMEKRTNSNAHNLFFAGYAQRNAIPVFFIGKEYANYHPDFKVKWLFYGIAEVGTRVTAYMQLKRCEHFPSVILLNTSTGAKSGIVVPHYHKTK